MNPTPKTQIKGQLEESVEIQIGEEIFQSTTAQLVQLLSPFKVNQSFNVLATSDRISSSHPNLTNPPSSLRNWRDNKNNG